MEQSSEKLTQTAENGTEIVEAESERAYQGWADQAQGFVQIP
jgi:hypothetical protein